MRHLWSLVFDRVWRQPPPASESDLAFLLASIPLPLSEAEVRSIVESQRNPWRPSDARWANWQPEVPSGWVFPPPILPESYLDLLRWSNGASVEHGLREIDFFTTRELRTMMVDNGLPDPRHMPGAIPFGGNGGGNWFLFDTRGGLVDGEYPILFVSEGGSLYYDCATRVATTLEDLCRGTVGFDEAVRPPDSLDPDTIDVILVRPPAGGLRALSTALRELGLVVPTVRLRSYLEGLPKPLLRHAPLRFRGTVSWLNGEAPFLEIVENVGRREDGDG